MDSMPTPVNLLSVINRSSAQLIVQVPPWGKQFSLDVGHSLTLGQKLDGNARIAIDVQDILGVMVHPWPTVPVDITTDEETVTLESRDIAPQSTSGLAPGWPENSRDIIESNSESAACGFFLTDSRTRSKKIKVIASEAEINFPLTESPLWITAVSRTGAPVLEIHDAELVLIASQLWLQPEGPGWEPGRTTS